jgi:hypothetical protein
MLSYARESHGNLLRKAIMHQSSCLFSNNVELQHLYSTTGCKITSTLDFAKPQKRRQRIQVRILSSSITSYKQTMAKHQIALRTPLSLATVYIKATAVF